MANFPPIVTHVKADGTVVAEIASNGALTLTSDVSLVGTTTLTGNVTITGDATASGLVNPGQTTIALGTATNTTLASLDYGLYFVTGLQTGCEIYIPAAASVTAGDYVFVSSGLITSFQVKSPDAAATASLTLAAGEGGHIAADGSALYGWGVGANT